MQDYKEFLDKLFQKIEEVGIDITGLPLDHIAYYTASEDEYNQVKPEFEALGDFSHEAIISNRRVGVIILDEPFLYKDYSIEAAELIEPKEGETHSSGWEHAEFVTSEDYTQIIAKYPNIKWETGSMNRPIYSHITAILDTDLKIKFHDRSIIESIKLERSQNE